MNTASGHIVRKREEIYEDLRRITSDHWVIQLCEKRLRGNLVTVVEYQSTFQGGYLVVY